MTRTDSFRVPPQLSRIRQAREHFLAGRPLPDGVPGDLGSAWRRASFFGVRPDLAAVPAAPTGPDAPLPAAARPVLERLAPTLETGDRSVIVADERCRVLCWLGRRSQHTLRRDLSEEAVGHNSAALALRRGGRAEVHGPEHFLDLWQDVSAVSVPLRLPGAARALGTVTVVSGLCADRGPHPDAALVEATAAAIEAGLAGRAPHPPERLILDAFLRESAGGQPAVALDGRSRLVSEEAARLLSPEALRGLERYAAALLGGDVPEAHAGDGAPGSRPDSAPEIRLGEGLVARPVPVRQADAVVGVVAVARADAAGRATRRPVAAGPAGALAGDSVPWRHAVDRAVDLARTPGPLLLTGERGTGKTALGRAVLRGPDGATEPLTVDAASAPDGELEDLRPYLTSHQDRRGRTDDRITRPLLLRHVERLGQRDVAALIALLEARPELPLVVTRTPGTEIGPCLSRLLDTMAARSVTLPPLRERPEDLTALLSHLTPAPAPGHPRLTWTLDAVQALERHSWPGNVTQLAHLVREMAWHRRATGPVRRDELPDAVREQPASRHLGTIERAERETILEALRTHGGNKARAAAALGIARATLYRKLRGYR
ncbi:helix-turn-helix domain-containing protein [Streptomyces pinistramenti]|uniref:helix-turn-helix domain-containing protein n=1 Tax=Streptomyces pinistramenti TaxID=2884812 RepID=UPI001D06DD0B|nr:helix-turn-helix domain-containing protein [Streptomyces pinistramenti]MCB5909014.1 regulator [Streptomyces pinistramenti]